MEIRIGWGIEWVSLKTRMIIASQKSVDKREKNQPFRKQHNNSRYQPISPTFFEQPFCTKVQKAAFLYFNMKFVL